MNGRGNVSGRVFLDFFLWFCFFDFFFFLGLIDCLGGEGWDGLAYWPFSFFFCFNVLLYFFFYAGSGFASLCFCSCSGF